MINMQKQRIIEIKEASTTSAVDRISSTLRRSREQKHFYKICKICEGNIRRDKQQLADFYYKTDTIGSPEMATPN